jgi:putative RecB family exonuclease
LADDIYLHGYVDRLDVAPTGEVRIIDYKTGKSPKPGWEDKALFQLRVYALLYWREKNVIPKLLQLIYLGNSSVLKSTPTEQELVATEKSLMKIAESIRRAIETNTWVPRKSKLCDWCSFKSICPAHN